MQYFKFCLVALLSLWSTRCCTPFSIHQPRQNHHRISTTTSALQSSSSNFWDDLSNLFRLNNKGEDPSVPPNNRTRIATIPVKSIKPGGLRLFLMLYLMGMSNTPDPKSWFPHQSDDDSLEFWFHDQSARLSIQLTDTAITVERHGIGSTAYNMQESVIVHGILQELQQCAFDTSIPQANRLLIVEPNAIQQAQESLSFG